MSYYCIYYFAEFEIKNQIKNLNHFIFKDRVVSKLLRVNLKTKVKDFKNIFISPLTPLLLIPYTNRNSTHMFHKHHHNLRGNNFKKRLNTAQEGKNI